MTIMVDSHVMYCIWMHTRHCPNNAVIVCVIVGCSVTSALGTMKRLHSNDKWNLVGTLVGFLLGCYHYSLCGDLLLPISNNALDHALSGKCMCFLLWDYCLLIKFVCICRVNSLRCSTLVIAFLPYPCSCRVCRPVKHLLYTVVCCMWGRSVTSIAIWWTLANESCSAPVTTWYHGVHTQHSTANQPLNPPSNFMQLGLVN